MTESMIERLWFGDGMVPRAVRAALTPAEWVFRSAVARRNARFDGERANVTRSRALPALSVGNLTVGGTGKTPVAAWCIRRLRELGAKPALIMRGYGDDEWRVHALLNNGVDVVVTPDRRNGLVAARARGADCAVMDDAFQHRQAPRVVDLVLVSVDQWTGSVRMLPAGPFREGLDALRRASVIVLTQKVADVAHADDLAQVVAKHAPAIPIARVTLQPRELRLATAGILGRTAHAVPVDRTGLLNHPVSWISGRRVVAVSAIGDPSAFEAQLLRLGAQFVQSFRFRDHHSYIRADADRVARSATGTEGVVCTLKDAVKLAPLWPREAPPLWYVSQAVVIDRGADALDKALASVLAARSIMTPVAS